MKKFLKWMLGIGGCIFYYIVICAILGIDVYDPWDKMKSWVKGEKKEKEVTIENDMEEKDCEDME